jgi:glucan 1,3-beta-glucosidase
MWLNGFNDNLDGYPKVQCEMVECPAPYMGSSQPGAPPDPSKGKQGPFGTGSSTPEFGMCPIDKPFDNDKEVGPLIYFVQHVLLNRKQRSCTVFTSCHLCELQVMPRLGMAKINAFDKDTHGCFFWNFRTELESKWDFQKAVANGWLPTGVERISEEYVEKLEKICDFDTETESSWLWQVVMFVLFAIVAWQVYKWFVSADRHGYTPITSAESIPTHDNI